MHISVHICKYAFVQTNMCVYMCVYVCVKIVFIRKEGRAIRNQTEAGCASCPLFEDGAVIIWATRGGQK